MKKKVLFGGPKTREILCTPFVKRKKKIVGGEKRAVVAPSKGWRE